MTYRRILRYRRHLFWCSLFLTAVLVLVLFPKTKKHIRQSRSDPFIIDGGPWFKKPRPVQDNREVDRNAKPELDVKRQNTIVISAKQSVEDVENNFFRYIENKDVICEKDRRLGFQHDGGWNICMSPPFQLKEPCLIYSFGIGGDWRFEDEIAEDYHCKVLAFDPSMGLREHNRSNLIRFKPLGLSDKNEVTDKGWRLKTLLTHLIEEHHTHTLIDYLKFDIEFKEWKAIQNMALDSALDNVKQLGFELHFKHPQDAKGADLQITKDDFLRMYENLKILEDMNFKKFNYRLNPFCNYASNFTKRIRSRCYELHYMNMRFVKLHHMKGLDRKVAMLN